MSTKVYNSESTIGHVGFVCRICGNHQPMKHNYEIEFLYICNECLADLREIIITKRNKDKDNGKMDG